MASGNGITNGIIVTELCLVCKNKVRTETVFCTDVREWENIIGHGGQKLFGKLCHIGLYGSLWITGAINRQGLYKHANGIFKSGVISAVIDGGKKTVLRIGVSGHENTEQTCK